MVFVPSGLSLFNNNNNNHEQEKKKHLHTHVRFETTRFIFFSTIFFLFISLYLSVPFFFSLYSLTLSQLSWLFDLAKNIHHIVSIWTI